MISVLLPTRGAGPYLAATLDSVLGQEADFELIVSDNANLDETPAVLENYATDPRLRVIRQDSPLSVTENWNESLAAANGEYLLMIGDDDLLLPGYFASVESELQARGFPDCLTYNAFRFVAPGIAATDAFYGYPYFSFDLELVTPGPISAVQRTRLLERMFEFQTVFPLTMQLTVVRRSVVDRLPKGLFRTRFPDHYALGALLLRAATWEYAPIAPLVVGVSPKSFGSHFFGDSDRSGFAYLGRATADQSEADASVIEALAEYLRELKTDFGQELAGIDVDEGELALRRIWAWRKRRASFSDLIDAVGARGIAEAVLALVRPRSLAHIAEIAVSGSARNRVIARSLTPLGDNVDLRRFGELVAAGGLADVSHGRQPPSRSSH